MILNFWPENRPDCDLRCARAMMILLHAFHMAIVAYLFQTAAP